MARSGFALCALLLMPVNPGLAQQAGVRILASELLVARGDLDRLGEPALPAPHRQGLIERLTGALGLLPWLLIRNGDGEGAGDLAAWQAADLGSADDIARLDRLLETLSERHALDRAIQDISLIPDTLSEARAIHEAYCAGCHDGMQNGDPDLVLPARDLFQMGRAEDPEIFLARLFNGIKGDETIGFRNPMTDVQLNALWKYYRFY